MKVSLVEVHFTPSDQETVGPILQLPGPILGSITLALTMILCSTNSKADFNTINQQPYSNVHRYKSTQASQAD